MGRAKALAEQIAAQAPLAISACLEAVSEGLNRPLDEALRLEAALFGRLSETEDKREGVAAFLGKRKAVWQGK